MSHAIIVVGNERRFMEAARPFARYLRTQARCARVTVIKGAYLTPKELGASLRGALKLAPADGAVLVAYFGHGLKGAWGFALEHQEKTLRLEYAVLATTLAAHPGPLAILNDCCHAESLLPHLQKAGVTADRCLLISASKAEDVIVPGTGKEVQAQWAEGKIFETVVETETLCEVDMRPYVPPLGVRAGRRWKNAVIRLGNMLRPKAVRRPTYLFVNSPPNGWAQHRETVTTTLFGHRWGAPLDHHFFPIPEGAA